MTAQIEKHEQLHKHVACILCKEAHKHGRMEEYHNYSILPNDNKGRGSCTQPPLQKYHSTYTHGCMENSSSTDIQWCMYVGNF